MDHNDHMPIYDDFVAVAVQAGALKLCPLHSGVTINQRDLDAERRAYAIATNKWDVSELLGERTQIMAGVKDAISRAADECPVCAEIMDV